MPSLLAPEAAQRVGGEALARTAIRGYLERSRAAQRAEEERDWRGWLAAVFPAYTVHPPAPYHEELWGWIWGIRRGERAAPFVSVLPRGWAKSTTAELGLAAVAARRTRAYALYVCETQEQADDHVANVATMLELDPYARRYPAAASRRLGKYGRPGGWRRNRLRAESGFTLDAIGLDTASRGIKLDQDRPDLLVLDDLDGKLDTPATTERKLTTLTHSIIPAGATHAAVLALQNLVTPEGIFARLVDGRADFLSDRRVSGPHPAVRDLVTERLGHRDVIRSGEPTWPAMGLDACQALIDTEGLTAFLAERQHEVAVPSGGLFDHLAFRHCSPGEVPELVRTAVWVDPAVTDTDQSDACGIQVDGLAADDTIYRLWSWEHRASPELVLRLAITKALEYGALAVGVETDQGGDTWRAVYHAVAAAMGLSDEERPGFRADKAGAGHGPKAHRAAQMIPDYDRGEIVHVTGTHALLERALRRFPRTKPFDLVDAAFWSWHDLRRPAERRVSVR
jgi:hypothetical protein